VESLSVLVLFIALSFAAAAVARRCVRFAADPWYESLAKPAWHPAPATFRRVWTVLYVLIGVSGWIVARQAAFMPLEPMALFLLQLALNAAWPAVFFGLRRPGAALPVMAALLAAAGATAWSFAQRSSIAAGLLVPYLAWLTAAAVLNVQVWRLNRDRRWD